MSAVRRTVRIVSGVGVLALVGGVVVLGRSDVLPARAHVVSAGTVVDVPPSPTRLVCAGPLVLPDDSQSSDDAFDPVPVDPLESLSVVATTSGGGAVTSLDGGDVLARISSGPARLVQRDAGRPTRVVADPSDVPAQVAGAGSSLVTAGDLRGLAAASCQVPTADAWLVGGSTELGSTSLLVLQNAGSTPAVVHLEAFGATGPVDLDTEQYLVAPGAERVVVLGGIAAQERRVAVHVTATGGRVAAFVQDSTLDGFTPTGTDLVAAGAPPARRQVVPGVVLRETGVDDPDAGALRLLAPGDAATTVHVRLLGADGVEDLPGADALTLEPGVVTDVPLGGLAAGAYTVVVDADAAVVASVMVARPGDPTAQDPTVPTRERAWVPSVVPVRAGLPAGSSQDDQDAAPLGTPFVVVPDRTSGTLVLGAVAGTTPDGVLDGAGSLTGTLEVLGPDGTVVAAEPVDLPVGRTRAWRLADLAPDGVRASGARFAPTVSGGSVGSVGSGGSGGSVGSGASVAWPAVGLVAQVDRADGTLLSVLVPVASGTGTTTTTVVHDPRAGTR